MNLWDDLKRAIARMVARFAARKTEQQAEGMAQEARGLIAGAKDLARRNPAGFAVLAALLLGVLVLASRRRNE